MANLTITQLPAAGPITGTESVPIVQNGQTVRTTTAAISASPSQTQTFLTKVQEPTLPNSRYLSTGSGLGLTDGGAQSYLRLEFTGAAASLETVSPGVLVKTGATTIANRTLTTSGAGLSVTNGDGIAGNPTFALTGLAQALANASGTGMLAVVGGTTIAGRQIFGTGNQIVVANGNGSGDPTIALATDPVLPGTGAVTVPKGTTVQQPVGADGQIRFNTDTNTFDGYASGSWNAFSLAGGVTTFSAGSTGFTPSVPTNGTVTLAGVLNVSNGGTGVSTLTGYVRGNGSSAMTASATIPTSDLSGTISNAQLANSSVTYNGVNVALGASGTITATATNPLTIGTGLTGSSYDGSSPITIAIDSTVATLAGVQTLTNKTINGTTNTLSSIANSSLVNSSITVGTTAISLGASSLTLGGLTSVELTQNPTTALQAATKQYVDTLAASGIHYHSPVYVEVPDTTGNLNATYNNGASGVGATLTNAGTQAAFTADGVAVPLNARVLVYNQTDAVQNGVYTLTTVGSASTNWVLTRATDADTYAPFSPNSLGQGDAFFVTNGLTGAGETYICNTVGTITFGTTPITFAQISTAQVYTGTSPVNITGTVISLNTVQTGTGGTGQTSYAVGDTLYYASGTALSKLAIGANGYVMTSNGTAPQYVAQSTLSVGSATNAANVAITTDSTNADYYLTVVSTTTGNLPEYVATGLTANPSTGKITGGVSGGTF